MFMVITTIFILLLITFIFGWQVSYNFKRYSNINNYQGMKNYFKMKKGLYILFKKIPDDAKEVIKKELNEPIDNFLKINPALFKVLKEIENKHLHIVLFAYYQKKFLNEITNKKNCFLTTFDGRTILPETRDVEKIIIPSNKDFASEFERELLTDYLPDDKGSYMFDYVYQYFIHLRMEENVTPGDTTSLPGSFIRFNKDEGLIQNTTNFIQRKRSFKNLNITYEKISK